MLMVKISLVSSARLKCNGTHENTVPPPPIYGSKRFPSQIVIMLEKGTSPLSGAHAQT